MAYSTRGKCYGKAVVYIIAYNEEQKIEEALKSII